jgi:hypothetical protein
MAKGYSYLQTAVKTVKSDLNAWIAENTGSGLGTGLGYEVLATSLGAFQQGRQIEYSKLLLMIEHVSHVSTSVQDGRVRATHDFRINVRAGNVLVMTAAVDRLYERMQEFEGAKIADAINISPSHTVDYKYYPDSVGLEYQFEDEYTAYLDFTIEITGE